MAESEAHARLKRDALIWLNRIGCYLFSCEVSTPTMGIADAAGVKRNGDIYIVEAKVSQADLVCSKQEGDNRRVMINHRLPADFFYLILSDGLVVPEHYNQWGVIRGNYVRVRAPRKKGDPEQKARMIQNVARSCCLRVYGNLIYPGGNYDKTLAETLKTPASL